MAAGSRYLLSPAVGALLSYFLEVLLVAAVQSQQSSEFSEKDAGACADARTGSRYQDHFPPQGGHLERTFKGVQDRCPYVIIDERREKRCVIRPRGRRLTLNASPDDIRPFGEELGVNTVITIQMQSAEFGGTFPSPRYSSQRFTAASALRQQAVSHNALGVHMHAPTDAVLVETQQFTADS